MWFARVLGALSLAFLVASGLEGCVFGNAQCDYGREECVGTDTYRVCHGGEGHYSWDTRKCPGVQPVCSLSASGLAGCTDLATPPAYPPVSVLLDAGTAKLSNVVDLERDGSADLVFGGDVVSRSNDQGEFCALSADDRSALNGDSAVDLR